MSIVEIDIKKFPYAGWLPTVSGSLSFRHIGEAEHPTPSIYANVTATGSRLILAYQRRPVSDVLFGPILHYFLDISGSFWFVVQAKGSGLPGNANELEGKIFIYKSSEDWREKSEPIVRPSIKRMNDLRLAEDTLAAAAESGVRYQEAKTVLQDTADIELDFQLHRNGEAYFSQPTFKDPDLEYASKDLAKNLGQDFGKWIADQGYFFLRDIGHHHQHHRANEDTILILQDRKVGEIEWRQNIIYSLYYQIIRAKRSDHGYSTIQAIGILGYCRSFKLICARQFTPDQMEALKSYNDDALLQSMEAKISENTARAEKSAEFTSSRSQRFSNVRAYTIAFVALIISVFGTLAQNHIGTANRAYSVLNRLSDYVAIHFVGFCLAGFGLVAFIWIITSRWLGGFVYDHMFGRDVLELSNAGRNTLLILYPLFATGIVILTAYLGWPALIAIWHAIQNIWDALH